jgi:hypothetical protein
MRLSTSRPKRSVPSQCSRRWREVAHRREVALLDRIERGEQRREQCEQVEDDEQHEAGEREAAPAEMSAAMAPLRVAAAAWRDDAADRQVPERRPQTAAESRAEGGDRDPAVEPGAPRTASDAIPREEASPEQCAPGRSSARHAPMRRHEMAMCPGAGQQRMSRTRSRAGWAAHRARRHAPLPAAVLPAAQGVSPETDRCAGIRRRATSSVIADARICDGVQHVGQQVTEDHHHGEDEASSP